MKLVSFISFGELHDEVIKKMGTVEAERAFTDFIRNWISFLVGEIEKELEEGQIISRETKALYVERISREYSENLINLRGLLEK